METMQCQANLLLRSHGALRECGMVEICGMEERSHMLQDAPEKNTSQPRPDT